MVSSLNKSVLPASKYLGWGDTGIQETSTDKLRETLIPIVPSTKCLEKMAQTESIDENLIVCAGGIAKGPCKVQIPKMM